MQKDSLITDNQTQSETSPEALVHRASIGCLLWLSFTIGRIQVTNHVFNGREFLRAVKARWDDMGCPLDWNRFELAVLQNNSAITLRVEDAQMRAMNYLAGECPL